jgi:hypothetical protein
LNHLTVPVAILASLILWILFYGPGQGMHQLARLTHFIRATRQLFLDLLRHIGGYLDRQRAHLLCLARLVPLADN